MNRRIASFEDRLLAALASRAPLPMLIKWIAGYLLVVLAGIAIGDTLHWVLHG